MALDLHLNDREYDKFEFDANQGTVVKTRPQGKGVSFGLISEEYDNIEVTYSTGRMSGLVYRLGVVTVAVLLITYDASGNIQTVTKA